MVSPKEENIVYGIKLSSVGPSKVTGSKVVHEPSNMDLAMKLHYLKGVYYFPSQAAEGMTVPRVKESMFYWLNEYFVTCGRIKRWEETGRPYIKCNDCGVRVIEAKCDLTIDQWLAMDVDDFSTLQKLLVPQHVLGPELSFSPACLIQLTQFKCGGFSLGLSLAHILADAYSASDFFNSWAQVYSGIQSNKAQKIPKPILDSNTNNVELTKEPISMKKIESVGDHWIYENQCDMETLTLHLTSKQLTHLHSKAYGRYKESQTPTFESLCAIFWQCIAKIRQGHDTQVVTLCKNDPSTKIDKTVSNSQRINVAEIKKPILDVNPSDLLRVLIDQVRDENNKIEETIGRDNGVSDYIIYGVNLTFVDLEGSSLYGLELNGIKPIFVNYMIKSIGDKGVVLVLQGPPCSNKDNGKGKVVTFILPKDQIVELKNELKKLDLLLENKLG